MQFLTKPALQFYLQMQLKNNLKRILPLRVLNIYRAFASKYKPTGQSSASANNWSGNFLSWEEALKVSGGYDDKIIFEKCRQALQKVKNGEAVYERDSVLFNKIQYSWPLLACFENVALENDGALNLIDFGGSLGSTYFQNRQFLESLASLTWTVVEQEHFVKCGIKEFKNEHLNFAFSIEEALINQNPQCLLLASVLPYLPNPMDWLEKFCNYGFDYIIVERTSFSSSSEHFLTVQKVPESIYQASYPCWFFNEKKFIEIFLQKYVLIAEFDDSVTQKVFIDEKICYWKGFFFKKIK